MKKYKAIKGIAVAFAIITLLAVFSICFVELLNIDMAKDMKIFAKICELLKLDMENENLRERLIHYSTVIVAISYIFTFFFWLITFKVGAKAIIKAKKENRQLMRNSGSEVKVNTSKDLEAIRKAQARQKKLEEKIARRQEEYDRKHPAPVIVQPEVKVVVEQPKPVVKEESPKPSRRTEAQKKAAEAQSKLDDILNSI